ncbi:ribose 5-phosphate isomerase B [Pyrinomonas methylaliphatogenes]|nr:ribose 5-phosphate isomerase B [Pyrinomonas methylaliphatogenes]MBX5479154.1 ribose 5-phosphate isomerase B [Pyrinomonas methylaliphatogenes]
MKVALASDHAGYEVKESLKPLLRELGLDYVDFGTHSTQSVDYPDFARLVAESIRRGDSDQGVLVCGSGAGMAIAANKVPGIRAVVAWNAEIARLAREHNDANVLAIGARTTPPDEIERIVRAWFSATFAGGRHRARVEKIEAMERVQSSS